MTTKDYTKKARLTCGIGINDANYPTSKCKYFSVWRNMIARCYSKSVHSRQPTYVDCSAIPEWHSFMAFRSWMKTQDWEGKQSDKDLLTPGNKIYRPDTCIFISQEINKLLNDRLAKRGKYPQGVYFDKYNEKFKAQISNGKKKITLGLFFTIECAARVYREGKSSRIKTIANNQTDKRLKLALLKHAEIQLKN